MDERLETLPGRTVRAFAAAIRKKFSPIEEGTKVASWLVWVDAYAVRIDSLK